MPIAVDTTARVALFKVTPVFTVEKPLLLTATRTSLSEVMSLGNVKVDKLVNNI